jgi:hypothetical protein
MKGRPTPNANPGQAQSRLWLHRRLEGKKRRGNELQITNYVYIITTLRSG